MPERIFNFGAGPAVLPEAVIAQAQRDLMALPGVGMSVLEISHRSKAFDEIIQGCEADIRKLAGISPDYHILFLQGGASMQFSMVPMNLLPAGGRADYIVTGSWSKKAVKEAKRVGAVQVASTTESDNFNRIPAQSELKLDPAAAYVHMVRDVGHVAEQRVVMEDRRDEGDVVQVHAAEVRIVDQNAVARLQALGAVARDRARDDVGQRA